MTNAKQSSRMSEDYELPKSAGGTYTKLKNGDTKLRILTSPTVGWEYFTVENKPVRQINRFTEEQLAEKPSKDNRSQKEFWAMVVWNYETNNLEVLEITQFGIKESILKLSKDADFGNPNQYDIKISRQGEGQQTRYQVIPLSKSEFNPENKGSFENVKEITLRAMSINTDALLSGGDPFMNRDNKSELPF